MISQRSKNSCSLSVTHKNSRDYFLMHTENIIELITSLGMPDLPNGVNETAGMCQNNRNSYQTLRAPAYSINKGTMITLAASDVVFLELTSRSFKRISF